MKKTTYTSSRHEGLAFRTLHTSDDLFVFRIGNKKHKKVQDENLEVVDIDDYPDVYVIVNNDPDIQKIAISRNKNAFTSSTTVSSILEQNYSVSLASYSISIYIKPIFEERDFWSVIHQYEGRLQALNFELIKPNLANISGTFKDEIRDLADSVNSHTTKLNLNAPENSTLINVNEDNENINGLVKYASEGGGEISIKAKGIKKIIKTKTTIKETSIRDIELRGSEEQVINAYKKIVG